MVTVGSDSHKWTHTLVAVDGNGRELGHRTIARLAMATPSAEETVKSQVFSLLASWSYRTAPKRPPSPSARLVPLEE
jgi:hypothetical protein